MAGLHCTDCIFGTFSQHPTTKLWQGSCSKGYTLTNPRVTTTPEKNFAKVPSILVPTVDPYGKRYLREDNVCKQFMRPNPGTVNEDNLPWKRVE